MSLARIDYRSGYSVGVGGVVLFADKVLLVRAAAGVRAGEWAIPGGYVEPGETIEAAVRREILEETGAAAEPAGIIAVRHRVLPGENSAYFVFLMRASGEATHPDGVEVDEARYFTLPEAQALAGLNALSRLLVVPVLEGKTTLLSFQPHPQFPRDEYMLFL